VTVPAAPGPSLPHPFSARPKRQTGPRRSQWGIWILPWLLSLDIELG
jgi:hypothetical protein